MAIRKKAGIRKKTASSKPNAKKKQSARKTARRRAPAKPRTSKTGASHPAAIARLYPQRIGTVVHYYAQAQGAIVELERGELHVGDAVHIRGHTTDFYERIQELKIDDRAVEIARRGQTVGMRVSRTVRESDGVFLLSE